MKPTDADRDPAFDRLIARGLEKETDASGNACPDADLLAAWFDRSLSALEAERIEAHASSCACCQQILADLARSEPEVTRAAPVPLPVRPWHWHWRWAVPLATAVLVIVVGTRTLRAPGPVLIPASTPPPDIGGRPSTWVELQQAHPASGQPQPAARAAGGPAALGQAADRVATAPREAASPAAAGGISPRKQDEMAKALPAPLGAAVDRMAPERRYAARAEEKAQPAAANAVAPSSLSAAESVSVTLPPRTAPAEAGPGRTGASSTTDRAAQAKAEGIAEKVTVAGAAPAVAATQTVARKPVLLARESAAPMPATSGTGPSGAAATWRYGQGGVIERSTDRGETWERQPSGVTTVLVDGSAPNERVCWIVGHGGVVLRSVDGRTWQQVPSPTLADLVSVHAWSDSNATITASDRSEYETTDGGRTWRRR